MNYTAHKNAQFIFYVGLISQADTKLLQVNPTIAAGDFKVSTDGAAFADLGTLPVVTPAGGTSVKITLSAGEMNGDNVFVQMLDAAGAQWCNDWANIITTPQDASLVQIDGTANASATLNVKKINVVNNSGDAIVAISTGSNGYGINATGNGSGSGIAATGGTTGDGIHLLGGNTSGNGLYTAAQTSGMGIFAAGAGSSGPGIGAGGGTNSNGFQAIANGSGSGIVGVGGATGHGWGAQGGATSGNGISAFAVGSGTGMALTGVGDVSLAAPQGISGALETATYTSIADAIFKRDFSAITGEASRSLLNCMRALRNKWSFSGNTYTVTKEDNTTPAWTATVTTNAAAAPVDSFTGS